jgi:hypothetical protein
MIVTCLYKIVAGLAARNDARDVGGRAPRR